MQESEFFIAWKRMDLEKQEVSNNDCKQTGAGDIWEIRIFHSEIFLV